MTTKEGVLSATEKARNLHLCIVRAVLQFLGAVILFALGQLGNLSFAYKSYAGHPPWISQVQSIGLPIIFFLQHSLDIPLSPTDLMSFFHILDDR